MATNVLLLTVDDMNGDTPGCCGGPPQVTPTVDRLAAEGIVFHRAHVAIAVCQPSRSVLLTGRYPHRNGAEGFNPIRDDVPLLTEVLQAAGYECGILGKVQHLQPQQRFGWSTALDMEDLGMGRSPQKYGQAASTFFQHASDNGRPWFLMANAHDPHRPFHGSDQERQRFSDAQRATYPAPSHTFRPGDWPSPGFLPDLPGVRREVAEYLSSSRRSDDVIAAVLQSLQEAGAADDTLVMFLSDNGMAFPFAKSNCYLHSTRTPFVVRWPHRIRPHSVDDTHYVSGLDVVPTVCEALQQPIPEGVDGRSFLPLLEGRGQSGREQIITVYHETSSKDRFEMRCVQDQRWGYIWNAWSDGHRAYDAENMEGLTWASMAQSGDPDVRQRVNFYRYRMPEEIYAFDVDPDALMNRIDDPRASESLENKRSQLASWMWSVKDPLLDRYQSARTSDR